MRSFIVLLSIALVATKKRQIGYRPYNQESCIADQYVDNAFRIAYDDFAIDLYQTITPFAEYTVTISPLTLWISLAAIAEGSDQITQNQIFAALNLPENACSRQKLYGVATKRLNSNRINLLHTKALFIDQDAQVNPTWDKLVRQQSLLDVIPAPIKSDKESTLETIKQLLSLKTYTPNIQGNSVLLNSVDYYNIWTHAFSDALVERAPFYSQTGQKIGSVDLMTMDIKARIGYVPSINSKIIELPVGPNGEYIMIFALVVDNDAHVKPAIDAFRNSTLLEVLASLQISELPIRVALPRFVITSEIDLKPIVEGLGIVNLWRNPQAARYISTPPAQPSDFIHRASLTLDTKGTYPPQFEYTSKFESTGDYWKEFIADRPFMLGLFDTETYSCHLATFFSKPTYPY